jgi:hypothetical protein
MFFVIVCFLLPFHPKTKYIIGPLRNENLYTPLLESEEKNYGSPILALEY